MVPRGRVRPIDIDRELLARCRAIPTSTWSDALDATGIAGVVDGLLWRSGGSRVSGRAMTVREDVAAFGTHPFEAFDVGGILDAAGADEILVVDMGGEAVSTFGGLAARAATRRGIAGVLIDGACRDVEEIRASGLALASRHMTPRSGKRRVRVAEIGGRVRCGGVDVSPGDIVVADETGAVVVPSAKVAEALGRAEDLAARDKTFAEKLDDGASFKRIAADLRHA